MRRNRIFYFAILFFSLILISFYGGAISYGLFFCMLLIPVVSLAYLFIVYKTYRIYQKIDTKFAVANQIVPYYLTIQNSGIVPISSFGITFYSSFSTVYNIEETQYEFAPHSGMKCLTDLICRYRGEYEVGVKEIEICDFFRLFSFKFKNREPLRVVVRPNLVQYEKLSEDEKTLFSSRESAIFKDTVDVLVREYVPGDDSRMIHWKNSAATGKLMVKNLTGEEKNGIGIILNAKRYTRDIYEYLPLEDKMLEKAVSMSMYFLNRNSSVNAYTVTDSVSQIGMDNMEGFNRYYDEMSEVTFTENDPDDEQLLSLINDPTLYDNRTIFIIVHKKSENAVKLVDFLNENNIAAMLIEVS